MSTESSPLAYDIAELMGIFYLLALCSKLSYMCFMFYSYLSFGCLSANFGPLSRGQPHSANFSHPVLVSVFYNLQPEGHLEAFNKFGYLSHAECPVGL